MLLFWDSFFSTFILTFQGELVLTTMLAFDYSKIYLYLLSVSGGILGLVANYAIGRGFVGIFLHMLDEESINKYNKTQKIIANKILYFLPITAFGFINAVLILDGTVGQFFNMFGSTLVLLCSGVITFFCGMFQTKFLAFLLVISISRLFSYYYYIFIFSG